MMPDFRCSVCRMAAFDLDGRGRCRWCRANPAPVECAGDCGRQAARTVDGGGLCAHCDLDDPEPHDDDVEGPARSAGDPLEAAEDETPEPRAYPLTSGGAGQDES